MQLFLPKNIFLLRPSISLLKKSKYCFGFTKGSDDFARHTIGVVSMSGPQALLPGADAVVRGWSDLENFVAEAEAIVRAL